MNMYRIAATATVLLVIAGNSEAQFFGPQTTIVTPSHNISDSFYERNGIDFDFDLGPFKFRQGSFDAAIPSVGGYTGDRAGATGGWVFGKGKNRGRIRFAFGQGSNRTHSMEAPVLTIANGRQGFVTNSTQTPFVTGVVPFVGGNGPINVVPPHFASMPGYGQAPVTSVTPYYGNATAGIEARLRAAAAAAAREDEQPRRPRSRSDSTSTSTAGDRYSRQLESARGSSAGQPAPSVASILAAQADSDQVDQDEAMSFYDRGKDAERRGKAGVAKIYYRNALRTARGKLRDEIEARMHALRYK